MHDGMLLQLNRSILSGETELNQLQSLAFLIADFWLLSLPSENEKVDKSLMMTYDIFAFSSVFNIVRDKMEKRLFMVSLKFWLLPRSQFCIWHFGFCLQSKYLLHLVLRDAKFAINTIFMTMIVMIGSLWWRLNQIKMDSSDGFDYHDDDFYIWQTLCWWWW